MKGFIFPVAGSVSGGRQATQMANGAKSVLSIVPLAPSDAQKHSLDPYASFGEVLESSARRNLALSRPVCLEPKSLEEVASLLEL